MREKMESILRFASSDAGLPKVMHDYRERSRAVRQVLERNPEILSAVHQDLQKLSPGDRKGRKGDFTSENILRALLVQHAEGRPFRETVIRSGGDGFLEDFVRLPKKAVMDYSFLEKCFLAIRPETWRRVNRLLGQYGVQQKAFNAKVIRAETTVIESNVHYPSDSSLLWDTWRVAARLLGRARDILPESVPHRLHTRKIKKLSLHITRYIISKWESRRRDLRAWFATLIEGIEWIVGIAGDFCEKSCSSSDLELAAVALELRSSLPTMRTIAATARRAQLEGQSVPARERVFSLFEPHTELIKRGKRSKPVEFGQNLIMLAEQGAG